MKNIFCRECGNEMSYSSFTSCFGNTAEFYVCEHCHFALDKECAEKSSRRKIASYIIHPETS